MKEVSDYDSHYIDGMLTTATMLTVIQYIQQEGDAIRDFIRLHPEFDEGRDL